MALMGSWCYIVPLARRHSIAGTFMVVIQLSVLHAMCYRNTVGLLSCNINNVHRWYRNVDAHPPEMVHCTTSCALYQSKLPIIMAYKTQNIFVFTTDWSYSTLHRL